MTKTALLALCWALVASSTPVDTTVGVSPLGSKGGESGGGIDVDPNTPSDAQVAATPPLGNLTSIWGASSASNSRIPVGKIIRSCTVPNSFALTFDDGPWIYTGKVLDMLKEANMPATFFLNGHNRQDIEDPQFAALVRRQLAEGHQVAHHTYVFSISFVC